MKVALIFPNINLGRVIKLTNHPPLGLAYLAAAIEKAGYQILVIDATAENLDYKKLIVKLQNFNPDVVGITTNILLANQSLILSRLLKSKFPETKIVFGGPWASVVYDKLLKKRFCDFVVVGEGEVAIVKLLYAIEQKELPNIIPGIAYLSYNNSVQLEPPSFITNLDTLPFPAWHLFPSPKKYVFNTRGKIYYPILTSRGCPYQCNHCTKIIHGSQVRFRSVQNVIDEIRYLKEKFAVNEILIADDNFTIDQKRAEAICDEIIKNDFKVLINLVTGVRADKLSLRLLRKLKRAGTYVLCIGVESGNQEIINKIGKKLDLNTVRSTTKLIKKEKIYLNAFFMMGHPFDTVKTMTDTINFALEIGPFAAIFFKVIAFPGTSLYDLVKRDGKFLMALDEIDRGYYTTSANFEIYAVKGADVQRMINQAYRKFYLRPRKLLQGICKVRSWVELKYLIITSAFKLFSLLHLIK